MFATVAGKLINWVVNLTVLYLFHIVILGYKSYKYNGTSDKPPTEKGTSSLQWPVSTSPKHRTSGREQIRF